jgi:hypothetical protein
MCKQLADHNVLNRSETVFGALAHYIISVCPKLLVTTNRIDRRDISRAMLYAEKTCRQPDRPPWSEALHLASKAVTFWKTFISGAKNSTNISDALSSICADLKLDEIPTIPLNAAKIELTQAQKGLQDCRAHAVENRQKFLSKLIEAERLSRTTSPEKRRSSISSMSKP